MDGLLLDGLLLDALGLAGLVTDLLAALASDDSEPVGIREDVTALRPCG